MSKKVCEFCKRPTENKYGKTYECDDCHSLFEKCSLYYREMEKLDETSKEYKELWKKANDIQVYFFLMDCYFSSFDKKYKKNVGELEANMMYQGFFNDYAKNNGFSIK